MVEVRRHECYCCLGPAELVSVLIKLRNIQLCDICIEMLASAALRYRTEDEYERLKNFAP